MVLYAVDHGGFLSLAIVHRLTINREQRAVLLIDLKLANENYEKNKDIFDEVLYYEANQGINSSLSSMEIEAEIIEKYDVELSNICWKDYDEIYDLFDYQDSIGIYFSCKNIRYKSLEVEENYHAIINEAILYSIQNQDTIETMQGSKTYFELLIKHNVYTENELLTIIPYAHFSYLSYMSQLQDIDKEKILQAYNIQPQNLVTTNVIFLPISLGMFNQFFRHVKDRFKNIHNHRGGYFLSNSIFIDYLIEDTTKIAIKSHPSTADCLSDYKDAIVLPYYFPIEFISLIDGVEIDTVYAIKDAGATRIYKVLDVKNQRNIPIEYYWNSFLMHKLSALFLLKNYICMAENDAYCYGISEIFLNGTQAYLSKITITDFKTIDFTAVQDNSLIVIDTIIPSEYNKINHLLNNLDDASVVCFLDSAEYLDFMKIKDISNDALRNNLTALRIQKEMIGDRSLQDLSDEYIYIYCKNTEMQNKMTTFKHKYPLKFTRVQVSINVISNVELAELLNKQRID